MEDVNMRSWREDAVLEFDNKSDGAIYDIDLVLHVNNTFSTAECQMIISATTPDSLHTSEIVTVNTPFQRSAPKASSKDIVIPYRRHVTMPKRGLYRYTMRPSSPLEGVEAAGMIFKPQK